MRNRKKNFCIYFSHLFKLIWGKTWDVGYSLLVGADACMRTVTKKENKSSFAVRERTGTSLLNHSRTLHPSNWQRGRASRVPQFMLLHQRAPFGYMSWFTVAELSSMSFGITGTLRRPGGAEPAEARKFPPLPLGVVLFLENVPTSPSVRRVCRQSRGSPPRNSTKRKCSLHLAGFRSLVMMEDSRADSRTTD